AAHRARAGDRSAGRGAGGGPRRPPPPAAPRRRGHPPDGPPPQLCLPRLVLPGLPARDPLRAVHEILVEEIGDASRQLVAATLVCPAQVVVEGREARSILQRIEDRAEMPYGHRGLEG